MIMMIKEKCHDIYLLYNSFMMFHGSTTPSELQKMSDSWDHKKILQNEI